MNLSSQIQQEVEKWSKIQGISTEQFIIQAVAEKVSALNQQIDETFSQVPQEVAPPTYQEAKLCWKEGILVVETEPLGNLDINAFIDQLREERIQEQMTL